MDWQRDPKTGEWVAIDPMTQSTTGQEPNPALRDPPPPEGPYEGGFGPSGTEAGYTTGDAGVYPVMSPQMAPGRTAEGAPIYGGSQASPPARPVPSMGGYDNADRDAQTAWVEAAKDRGNIVRFTADGVFEIDPNTREVISQMPPMPRMN